MAGETEYLTREQIGGKHYKDLGCDNPIDGYKKLVSLAAQKKGPPQRKFGGTTAPALSTQTEVDEWLAQRSGRSVSEIING
jgi:hypothetical protein